MIEDFLKHPSNIARSASEYLTQLSGSEKTKRTHEDILFLFVQSLCGDSTAVVELDNGEFVLKYNWEDYYGGAVSSFIDWWIPRKVMSSATLQSDAPGVMRKWIKWCYKEDYFDKEHYDEYISAVQRLNKVEKLLYELHSPQLGSLLPGKVQGNIIPITRQRNKAPQRVVEGYMRVAKLDNTNCYLENEEGLQMGPVRLSKPVVDLLRIGDVMDVLIGKFGETWKVLESGGVSDKNSYF
jgi:hypothetical protein